MPLTSSVMRQSVSNFRLRCCSKKFQMLQKNVKSLLGQLQVCIFAEIVFGVRCTLSFSCSLKFVVRLVVEAMLQRNNHCLEIYIRNNSANNAFPRETSFSH